MCEPVSITAGVLAVAGMAMQMKAQGDAASAQQSELNRQVSESSRLFDERINAQREASVAAHDIRMQDYDARQQIARDTEAGRRKASDDYEAQILAERGKQAGFQQRADAATDETLASLKPDQVRANMATEGARRGEDIASAVVDPSSAASVFASAPREVRDRVAAKEEGAAGAERARGQALGELQGFDSAARRVNLATTNLGTALMPIKFQADTSLSTLRPKLWADAGKYQDVGTLGSAALLAQRDRAQSAIGMIEGNTSNIIGANRAYEAALAPINQIQMRNAALAGHGLATIGKLTGAAGTALAGAGGAGAGPSWAQVGNWVTGSSGGVPTGAGDLNQNFA